MERRRHEQAYREGFSWATGEYFLGRMTITQIEDFALGRDPDCFDAGAFDAVLVIRGLELTSADELYEGVISHSYFDEV